MPLRDIPEWRREKPAILFHTALGIELEQALKEAASNKFEIRVSGARSPDKLVEKALSEGCNVVVIRADDIKATREARGEAKLKVCGVSGPLTVGKRAAREDAKQILEAIAKSKRRDTGVVRAQDWWGEVMGD